MIRSRDVFFCCDHDVLCRARRVRRPGALSRRAAAPHMSAHVLRARRAGPPTRGAPRVDHNVFKRFISSPRRVRLQDTYQRVSYTNASAMWLAAVHLGYLGSIVLSGSRLARRSRRRRDLSRRTRSDSCSAFWWLGRVIEATSGVSMSCWCGTCCPLQREYLSSGLVPRALTLCARHGM